MRTSFASILLATALAVPTLSAQQPPQQQPPAGQTPAGQQPARRAPRPYAQVITDKAVTDSGMISVHRVDDRWFFEVPDSILTRDLLLVTRIAAVPPNFEGFLSAGTSIGERAVRWERQGERVLLRTVTFAAVADDSLPIARSVASNNLGSILAAFPIQAFHTTARRLSWTSPISSRPTCRP